MQKDKSNTKMESSACQLETTFVLSVDVAVKERFVGRNSSDLCLATDFWPETIQTHNSERKVLSAGKREIANYWFSEKTKECFINVVTNASAGNCEDQGQKTLDDHY